MRECFTTTRLGSSAPALPRHRSCSRSSHSHRGEGPDYTTALRGFFSGSVRRTTTLERFSFGHGLSFLCPSHSPPCHDPSLAAGAHGGCMPQPLQALRTRGRKLAATVPSGSVGRRPQQLSQPAEVPSSVVPLVGPGGDVEVKAATARRGSFKRSSSVVPRGRPRSSGQRAPGHNP